MGSLGLKVRPPLHMVRAAESRAEAWESAQLGLATAHQPPLEWTFGQHFPCLRHHAKGWGHDYDCRCSSCPRSPLSSQGDSEPTLAVSHSAHCGKWRAGAEGPPWVREDFPQEVLPRVRLGRLVELSTLKEKDKGFPEIVVFTDRQRTR